MKRFHTTIKTVEQLKTAIDNSRASGIFKNGECFKEFAANVAAYISYCDEYGVLVLAEARPGERTLIAWYAEACAEDVRQELVRIYGPTVERGLHVVEGEYPDGSGEWVQCDTPSLSMVVHHFINKGCRVYVNAQGR